MTFKSPSYSHTREPAPPRSTHPSSRPPGMPRAASAPVSGQIRPATRHVVEPEQSSRRAPVSSRSRCSPGPHSTGIRSDRRCRPGNSPPNCSAVATSTHTIRVAPPCPSHGGTQALQSERLPTPRLGTTLGGGEAERMQGAMGSRRARLRQPASWCRRTQPRVPSASRLFG